MDRRQASEWGQIVSTIIGLAVLGFVAWDHRPSSPAWDTPFTTWRSLMKAWLPPAVIAAIMLCAAMLNIIAARRKHGEPSESNLLARFSGKRQQVKSLESDYKLARTQINNLKDELAAASSAKIQLDNELKRQVSLKDEERASFETSRRELAEAEAQIRKLESDAEEARKEKLLADENLRGVESDRNNFRKWYYELSCLKPSLEPQINDISNHVKVIAARPCLLDLKKRRIAVVDLIIRNDSFFDISIDPKTVTGGLFMNTKGLLDDPARALIDLNHPAVKNLRPTADARVSIIQPLLKTEAEEIEDALSEGREGYFWLGSLRVLVSVENADALEIDAKPLRFDSTLEHVYFREFRNQLTFDGEAIKSQELLRYVEALPFPERISIYQRVSDLYGESLHRLQQAEAERDPEKIADDSGL